MRFARAVGVAAIVGGVAFSMGWTPIRAQAGPDQLDQLVAPIALYQDELVAEVLAASTYPSEVDQAAQWLQQNGGLNPDQVADAIGGFEWDSSVKALTEFPSVLAMMDQNLSWTSALGDAYANQPDDVMAAVQALRQRAMAAGTLASSSEIRVSVAEGIISIEPASADTIYVPEYDGWAVYGAPISPWPEFVFGAGFVSGPHLRWGSAIRIGGAWGHVSWGWHNWASDWSHHRVAFDRQTYVSHSPSIIDHHFAPRAEPAPPQGGRGAEGRAMPRGEPAVSPLAASKAQVVDHKSDRGFTAPAKEAVLKPAPAQAASRALPPAKAAPEPPPPTGTKSGAFTAVNHGSVAVNNSARGQASMGVPRAAPPPRNAPAARSAPPPKSGGRGRGGL